MSMQPKLSIITINFNNLEGLKKTAESVLHQTWTDYEWIIVDGGSTDGSKEYIEDLAAKLSSGYNPTGIAWDVERFSMPGFTAKEMKDFPNSSLQEDNEKRRLFWCSEPDNGIYNAMNKGIAKASGEYLNFMNSGDCYFDSDTLEEVSAYMEGNDADVYYGDITIVADDSSCVEQITFKAPLDIFDLYYTPLCHQAQYYRTLLLKNKCFDEKYKIKGDHAKNIEFLKNDCIFKHLPFYVARYNNSGVSSRYNENTVPEMKRIDNECFSQSALSALSRLYKYENGHIYQRVNHILERGGFLSLVLKSFLKIAGTKKK